MTWSKKVKKKKERRRRRRRKYELRDRFDQENKVLFHLYKVRDINEKKKERKNK